MGLNLSRNKFKTTSKKKDKSYYVGNIVRIV